MAGPEHFEV